MNVIADSVDPAFSMIIIWGNPCIQATTVIWVESEATSWVKTHRMYQGQISLRNPCGGGMVARPGGQRKLQVYPDWGKNSTLLSRLSIICLHGAVA